MLICLKSGEMYAPQTKIWFITYTYYIHTGLYLQLLTVTHVRGMDAMLFKINKLSSQRIKKVLGLNPPEGPRAFLCRNASSSPCVCGFSPAVYLGELVLTCPHLWVVTCWSWGDGDLSRVSPHHSPNGSWKHQWHFVTAATMWHRFRDTYVCLITQSTVSVSAFSLSPVWIPPPFVFCPYFQHSTFFAFQPLMDNHTKYGGGIRRLSEEEVFFLFASVFVCASLWCQFVPSLLLCASVTTLSLYTPHAHITHYQQWQSPEKEREGGRERWGEYERNALVLLKSAKCRESEWEYYVHSIKNNWGFRDVTNKGKGKGGSVNHGANEQGEKERVSTEGLYTDSKLVCMLLRV